MSDCSKNLTVRTALKKLEDRMFITSKYNGYNRNGEQVAAGLFLLLIQPKSNYQWVNGHYIDVNGDAPIKAIVRHSSFSQFGHFMMGSCRIHGERIILSGSYGGDGLPCNVPKQVYDSWGIVLPDELRAAWNNGGGWNDAGSEATAMRKWALDNLSELRK